MKFLFSLLLFSSVLFPSCYFDASFGRVMCIEESDNPTQSNNPIILQTPRQQSNIRITNASSELLSKNLTPSMNGWVVSNGTIFYNTTIEYLNQTNSSGKASGGEETSISPNPVFVSPPPSKPECSDAKEKDWEYYCRMMWSQGMYLDCQNANVQAKEEILNNLAESSGSWQKRCFDG